MIKSHFIGKDKRASDVLKLIHTDVCGPMSISAKDGYVYFITFIDDYSRYGYVYLIKHKLESFEMFKRFWNEVEKQTEKSIKILRSDQGREIPFWWFFDLSGREWDSLAMVYPKGEIELYWTWFDPWWDLLVYLYLFEIRDCMYDTK